ncbi:uncharacterized protein LOC135842468 [Planococcus citri]|uniref:uncharacterized protein LOC135842468 n=1 Tax=Planococcus citri TaxID=170843 RepID=UPI0031F75579
MGKIITPLLVIFSCIMFIVSRASDEQDFKIIDEGLESFSNVVSIYKTEFTAANFSRLRNTVNEFNHSMANYLGKAGKHLNLLNALNNCTKHAYDDCVKLIYDSCEEISKTNGGYAHHEMLYPDDEFGAKSKWYNTVGISFISERRANDSFTSLKYLKRNATELKKILGAALIDINNDFGPEGFYVKNNQLSGRLILKKRSLSKKINTARAIIDRFSNMSIEFREDKNNFDAYDKLFRSAFDNERTLLTSNASLRAELNSKFRELANKKCNEYMTWYQSNHYE